MLDKLKQYKEIIAIVVFFLGGVTWLYKEFPNKNYVEEQTGGLRTDLASQKTALQAEIVSLQCLVDKYMRLTQLQIQNANLSKEITDLDAIRATTNANGNNGEALSPSLRDQFERLMSDRADKIKHRKANVDEMQNLDDQLARNVCKVAL